MAVKRLLPAILLLCVCQMLPARSWQEIRESGVLRVITADSGRDGLFRIIMPIDREQAMLAGFARQNNLRLEYVLAGDFRELFLRLDKREGDLVSGNVAITRKRAEKYLFSVPFDYTREVVFTGARSRIRGNSPQSLIGFTGRLLPGTTYVEKFNALSENLPQLKFSLLPRTISHDNLIRCVADGTIAYSVLNECDLDAHLAYNHDIRKIFAFKNKMKLAFAAAKTSVELIEQLNFFIGNVNPEYAADDMPEELPKSETKTNTAGKTPGVKPQVKAVKPAKENTAAVEEIKNRATPKMKISKADLPAIRKRNYLRMLTSNNFFCCHLHRGQLAGFEYELAKRFADQQKVMLLPVMPENFGELVKYLREGKGDFIAANYTFTKERQARYPDLKFCGSYGNVCQVLIGRAGEKNLTAKQLAGRKIHVRKSTSYYDTLIKLQKQGWKFTIVPVPDTESELTTVYNVAGGRYDLTVADETSLIIGLNCGAGIKKLMTLTDKQPFCWVVRRNNPQLAGAIEKFLKKEYRGTFYNMRWKQYYTYTKNKHSVKSEVKSNKLVISPYDDIFRKYGRIYDFDWCFLAAQSYTETRFNPNKINHIGATGLMQVMPGTAKDLGIRNLTRPDNGVHAGTAYMAVLRKKINRYFGKMHPNDQMLFILASYNAGYGHVQDARKLAVEKGWNPNVWFGNVEKAMALLEEPAYASRAKFGYCRSSETINYVRNIAKDTVSYKKIQLLNAQKQKQKKSGAKSPAK